MIYVVMGVSGCGKSSIGQMLAGALEGSFHDADDYHLKSSIEKMANGIALDDEDRKPWLEHLAQKIVTWHAEGDVVLACSALKQKYRDTLCSKAKDNVRFIYLKGSKSLIAQRLNAREGHFMMASLLDSQFEALEEPADAMVVSVGASPQSLVSNIVQKIQASYPIHVVNKENAIDDAQLRKILDQFIDIKAKDAKRVLILPPDITRFHSKAGFISAYLYHQLKSRAEVKFLPALGTHDPMSDEDIDAMFGDDIPKELFLPHKWRTDVLKLGEISNQRMLELSEGKLDFSMDVAANKLLIEGHWDLIISVGQTVPHEVIGMANYTKNVLVGVGGSDTIHKSHFLGAVYGMERIMGRTFTPVRQALNEGFDQYLRHLPIEFILTVIGNHNGGLGVKGVYCGNQEETYVESCKLSQDENLNLLDRSIKKAIVYLDPSEFKTTWLGNKAIYRTRMAMADGGELIVLAPALHRFGEDMEIDALIRQFGYKTTDETLEAVQNNPQLAKNLSAAAHLIHGTTNNRFSVTYCPKGGVSQEEIEGVNYNYAHYDDMVAKYPIEQMKDGWNTINGEEIFYVSNPALGLWSTKELFNA